MRQSHVWLPLPPIGGGQTAALPQANCRRPEKLFAISNLIFFCGSPLAILNCRTLSTAAKTVNLLYSLQKQKCGSWPFTAAETNCRKLPQTKWLSIQHKIMVRLPHHTKNTPANFYNPKMHFCPSSVTW